MSGSLVFVSTSNGLAMLKILSSNVFVELFALSSLVEYFSTRALSLFDAKLVDSSFFALQKQGHQQKQKIQSSQCPACARRKAAFDTDKMRISRNDYAMTTQNGQGGGMLGSTQFS